MKRLKTRPQFQAVLAGKTLSRTPHFALHSCALTGSPVEIDSPDTVFMFHSGAVSMGAMVPKRWAKRAVTRNAIKRQIYSVSAEFEFAMADQAHVVRLRSSFVVAHFVSASSDALKEAVRQELRLLFTQLPKGARA